MARIHTDDLPSTVYGNGGNDELRGGSGNDTFQGGAGNDALFGGTGADVLHGEGGADRLLVREGSQAAQQGFNDATAEDAVVTFRNGTNKAWTTAEIEVVDKVFAMLHKATDNGLIPGPQTHERGTNPSEEWWFKTGTAFATEDAKLGPFEDFAESFTAYFLQQAGRAWGDYKANPLSLEPIKGKTDLIGNWVVSESASAS
jgi:hypothetical protein